MFVSQSVLDPRYPSGKPGKLGEFESGPDLAVMSADIVVVLMIIFDSH